MNKTAFSLTIGGLIGALLFVAVFAAWSAFHPGWLRTALAGPANPIRTPAENPNQGDQPDTFTTLTPVPTSEPLPTTEDAACGGPEHMTFALLGVDGRQGDYSTPTRTDAISLINVRFTDKTASVLSIPRDLFVPMPNLEEVGITQARINTAYMYGEVYEVKGGGPQQFKETIELNFGIRVHRYVLVNFDSFVKFVDALGGIEVDVPKPINDAAFPTEDDSGTFLFEVPAGRQQMDGLTALRYARTRHQDDDYHRIERQQQVMLAIRDKLLSPRVIPRLPALIEAMDGLFRTDLSASEIASLACLAPQIDRSAISMLAITGEMVLPWTTPNGGRVGVPDREAIAPLVRDFLGE